MEYWQCETHPTMARHAKWHNAEISFWDESGIRADAVHGKTWGTPPLVLQVPGQRQCISAAAAVGAKGAFWFATYADALTGALFVDLLRRMLRRRRKPLQLILDGLPATNPSRSRNTSQGDGKRIVHDPPNYAPDLTPDAWVWRHAMRIGTACPAAEGRTSGRSHHRATHRDGSPPCTHPLILQASKSSLYFCLLSRMG